MKRIYMTPALIVAALLGLSACSAPFDVTRNAPFAPATSALEAPIQNLSVVTLRIDVPRTLTVSEANSIRPAAHIVWREDPIGDRHAQVETILRSALTPVLQPREGATPVIVALEVQRFHALTERARYTIGGSHEIEFTMTIAHAETGEVLSGPRTVDLTFRAAGGQAALNEEAAGITQRVSITERLQDWARAEFPAPAADLLSVASAQN